MSYHNMVGIIDYGLGNPLSIQNMVKKVGGKSFLSSDPEKLKQASQLILPGVGHFKKGMENLQNSEMDQFIFEFVKTGKPFLGICLGMQLLTLSSEEGNAQGLGIIPLKTKKFEFESTTLKIPHMGWEQISISKQHQLFDELVDPRFYFVHKYFVEIEPSFTFATANYNHPFSAVIGKENVIGMQFHPEKSHKFGMQVFRNFMDL